MRVYLIGMPNAGKTTIAKEVAKKLKFKYFSLDEEISKQTCMTIMEIFIKKGEEFFRVQESKALKSVDKLVDVIVDCGGGVVVDEKNKQLMDGLIIYIQRDLEDSKEGLNNDQRPLMAIFNIETIFQQRKKNYLKFADVTIINENIDETIEKIVEIIREKTS